MKKAILPLFAVTAILMSGCYYDNYEKSHPVVPVTTVCDTSAVMSFATNIEPIFQASCMTNCHSSASAQGSVILDTYVGAHKTVIQGKLLPAINHTGPFPMPLTGSLSSCDIGKITKWVNAGAPNN